MSIARSDPTTTHERRRRSPSSGLVQVERAGPLHRHFRVHGTGRRDSRRFGLGVPSEIADRAPPVQAYPVRASRGLARGESLRMFAHTFAGAFVFVTVFIA